MSRNSKKGTRPDAALANRVNPAPADAGETPAPPASLAHADAATSAVGPVFSGGRDWLVGILLLFATLMVYQQAWHAGFIWDDNGHITREDLRSVAGLGRIWFEFGATQQYYPVLHSAFWFEHRLWGDAPAGYHLLNIVLQAAASFLLYRLLRTLAVPGALFAAAAFALHPVGVETVAWVSEQKNTLSTVFGLLAVLAYLRFDRDRRRSWYAAATVLFALALGSKSVTATLPAALLVIFWWKRGMLSLRRDVAPLAPWFALALAAGLVTAWMERAYIGAQGAAFAFNLPERVLLAGRAPWFYLGKLLWPARLVFIYPHWNLDPGDAAQWLFPLATLGVLAVLFALRRRTRGPLAAALLYVGLLFPALGFFNIYPFVYSFVADHFQYLASAAMLAALAAGGARLIKLLPAAGARAARLGAFAVLGALAILTWREAAAYTDAETLWRTTLRRNPGCWMAWDNLGDTLLNQGRAAEAIGQFQQALKVKPNDDFAFNNLGFILVHAGYPAQAAAAFERALACNPGNADAHNNLGLILLRQGRLPEAIAHFERALAIKNRFTGAMFNLAEAHLRQGRRDEAIAEYRRGLAIDPKSVRARVGLAHALLGARRETEGVGELQEALRLDPNDAEANNDLGGILAQQGKAGEAIACFRRAVASQPGYAPAHWNLANALMGRGAVDEAIAQFREALKTAPPNPGIHNNLGLALMSAHRVDEARAEFEKALAIDPHYAPARRNLQLIEDMGR